MRFFLYKYHCVTQMTNKIQRLSTIRKSTGSRSKQNERYGTEQSMYFWLKLQNFQKNSLFANFLLAINILAIFCCRKLSCIFAACRASILAALIWLQAMQSANIINKEAILVKFIAAKSFSIFLWNYYDLNFERKFWFL